MISPRPSIRVQRAHDQWKKAYADHQDSREHGYNSPERVALRADMLARHDARFLPQKDKHGGPAPKASEETI